MARPTLVLAILFAMAGAFPASGGDDLFDKRSHDFGPIPRGSTQSISFQVTNKTQKPLRLLGVRIPCSCVSASITKNELKPGESTTVYVNLDTRRVSGRLEKYAFIQFDRREEVRLTIRADIRNDLILSPESLTFGRVKKGSAPDASVTVLFVGKTGKIRQAKSDSEFLQVRVKQLPAEDAGVSYQVTAHLRPDLPVGNWFSTVWLTTDDPALPRFPIGVNVEVQAGK
jgi:hypothetical protein